MPISTAIPNLNVAAPDVTGEAARVLTLKDMLAKSAMIPLQIQEQQQRINQQSQLEPLQVEQEQIKTEQARTALQSQKALMNAVASGGLNKFAGTDTPEGTGFDAAGAYTHLLQAGVLPEHASGLVNQFQTVAKNNSEIRKNLGTAADDLLKARAEGHKQMATDIANVMDLPEEQQGPALDLLKHGYLNNPLPGIDKQDLALFQQADVAHLPAIASMLKLDGQIDAYHAAKTEAEGKSAEAKTKATLAAAPTPEQLGTATKTVSTLNAIPVNMRAAFTKEMQAAPSVEILQKVQARADAANESFQRSADARAQAMAMKDVATNQVVAGKLVTEDEKLGTMLDQSAGIRSLLDMSKGGNQAATNAALTRFAEHEIVEGGVKRMNQLEYENLATKLGDYGRRFQSWVDGGFKGKMPEATNAEIGTILDAEDAAANKSHERNVGYVMDRYGKEPSASGAPTAAPKTGNKTAAAYTPPPNAPSATGPNGHKIVVDHGKWVDAKTGKPI